MKVKFRQWQIFVVVAREGSFTMAARILGMDPSAIMRRINQLEATLDMQLFIRDKTGLQMTTSARNLFRKIEPLVQQVEKTLQSYHGPTQERILRKVTCVIDVDLFSFWSGFSHAFRRVREQMMEVLTVDVYLRESNALTPRWSNETFVLRFTRRRPRDTTPFVFCEVPCCMCANTKVFSLARTMGSPGDLARFPVLSAIPTQRVAVTKDDVRFPLLLQESQYVANLRRLCYRVQKGEGIGVGIPRACVQTLRRDLELVLADWELPKRPIYLVASERARRHPTLIRLLRLIRARLTKDFA